MTAAHLPELDPAHVRTVTNPVFGDALDLVDDFATFLPTGSSELTDRLGKLVIKLQLFDAALSCRYRQDRLAVRLYQDRVHDWSLGVAIAVRGHVQDDIVETAICVGVETFREFLMLASTETDSRPSFGICVDVVERVLEGEKLTIVLAATSDWMCDELHERPSGRPGDRGDEADEDPRDAPDVDPGGGEGGPPRIVCHDYRIADDVPIEPCSQGTLVVAVQQGLAELGFELEVDGYYGPITTGAVTRLQSDRGLEATGVVDAVTWEVLVGDDALGRG